MIFLKFIGSFGAMVLVELLICCLAAWTVSKAKDRVHARPAAIGILIINVIIMAIFHTIVIA